MAKKPLRQYRGHLAPSDIATGMNAARRNAIRLLEDARLLLDSGRAPSAAALAILSIEESGKISILRALALARDQKEVAETWREYRSHTKKNAMWIFPQLVATGARSLEEFREVVNDESEHPQLLETLKQVALYTDCVAKGRWTLPDHAIDSSFAASLIKIAAALTSREDTTQEEIELWIKHIGPVWKKDTGWMKTALANWHREMVASGLADPDEEAFETFVWGQSPP